ncbi:MAG: trypsin-like peptidase domain-containing protein [Microcystis sp. M048S1]|uniref:VMAP-C domain-containing protein n=1 Tax=unclassified Microcystis TaxID=2643300 RepID=UPI00119692E6|nr:MULTISPECIES: trypsin-like peptidase domain-containing protein [unclassified Microcystis]MCA2903503.1 trypsin-like peptidase domain-containing protein [Microcystis sp. M035S1]MCA2723100.1 trypsin-like peptidase domain-containing protein [Microcystis sp. M176S2]MCA2728331.1 trypsin-like peptidase domain-containing protein [Microcystis sp. M166S2]MCA2728455.1 trypsin-like peptidase domain-containing protein [Microcystis sp. M162S2]MCA2746082.1 trypsin-like peptidase domain-containing protein 
MVASLEFSVVRIYKQRNKKDDKIEIVGAGFLISSEYLITCAHVVNQSIGEKDVTSTKKPTDIIECDFPIIASGTSLETTVEVWHPVKFNSNDPQDIAILKLKDSVSLQAQPVSLITYKIGDLSDHNYKAYGFSRNEGVWSDGKIIGHIANNKIQIEDNKSTGYAVEGGFSGTAIWDEQLGGVVGMAVMADKEKMFAKSAFFIPTNVLLKAWNKLLDIAQIEGKIPDIISSIRCVFENKNCQDQLNTAYENLVIEVRDHLVDLPRKIPSSWSDFIEILYQLDERHFTYTSQSKFSWLEIFIVYLVIQLNSTDALAKLLKEWLKKYQTKWEVLINTLENNLKQRSLNIAQKSTDKNPCLFVSLTEENKSLMLRAWIVKDINNYHPTEKAPQKRGEYQSLTPNEGISLGNHLQENELINHLKKFKRQSENICQSSLEKVQFFLPYRFIEKEIKPIDLFSIDEVATATGCDPHHWGIDHEIIMRFSERITAENINNQQTYLWIKKCQLFRNIQQQNLTQILKCEEEIKELIESNNQQTVIFKKPLANNDHPNKILKYHKFNNVIGSRLTNLSQENSLELKNILAILYETGIPLSLWIRPDANPELNCQEKLDPICQCPLEKLPEIIKNRRSAAWLEDNHIGNHLSLLWDDYQLVPPNYPLLMP